MISKLHNYYITDLTQYAVFLSYECVHALFYKFDCICNGTTFLSAISLTISLTIPLFIYSAYIEHIIVKVGIVQLIFLALAETMYTSNSSSNANFFSKVLFIIPSISFIFFEYTKIPI